MKNATSTTLVLKQLHNTSIISTPENGSKGEDSHFEEGVLFLHGHPKPSPGAGTRFWGSVTAEQRLRSGGSEAAAAAAGVGRSLAHAGCVALPTGHTNTQQTHHGAPLLPPLNPTPQCRNSDLT
ncbi:hypothetical protein E2C01_040420 [Portunus trituberculatus]|uniref:Uncharacterized protein n=1 Tax=Portunus trituberculatus TaxID=210409 RepID=A0A5B7FMM0_PORTR|nr:hypothetical protein [Portunus trituberculatus]